MQAFLASCKRAGIEIHENSMTSDAAVIWSVLWHGRMASNRSVYHHYRTQEKPVVCIDVGALRRNRTWKIALNHITAQGYYGHTHNLDWHRPEKLGIGLETHAKIKHSVLIAAQHPKSLQTADIDCEQWINRQIDLVRSVSDRSVIVRPHPRGRLNMSRIDHRAQIQQPQSLINSYDSFDLDLAYHAVINYNSGPGIQAALAGSTLVVDSSSLAYPVSSLMTDIERPKAIDRTQWLVEICHTEYLVEEIAQGTWLKRLEHKLA